MVNLADERVGQINKNTFGSTMKVIEYNRSDNILVEFIESGYSVRTKWDTFQKGLVRNPLDKTIYGLGYLGEGEYQTWKHGKPTLYYNVWSNMFERCYYKKYLEKYPSYIGCTVHEEWHNFQSFCKWYDENYYEIHNQKMNLDKDILQKGNKLYSPDTCVFVPQAINKLFIKCNGSRGNLPIGVSFDENQNKFTARCKDGKKNKRFGSYNTVEEAFQAYKVNKERVIRRIANEYKDQIPDKLFKAMISYEVEIDD